MSLLGMAVELNHNKVDTMRCIVKVTTSIYKTKSGSFVKKVELRDVKRKSQLLMSDFFEDYYYDVSGIENLEQVPDGEYELVPASINYGTYEYPCEEVETWKLIKPVDTTS